MGSLFASCLFLGPGRFILEDGSHCSFCEDKDKIPVVINNLLSTEIKKMPLQIICEEAGLFGSQVREIMKAKAHNDYIVEKYYTEIFGKALALKQGNYSNSENNHVLSQQMQGEINPDNCLRINEVNNVKCNSVDPKLFFGVNPQNSFTSNLNTLEISRGFNIVNWDGADNFGIWSFNTRPQLANITEPWPDINKIFYLPDAGTNIEDEAGRESMPSESKREVENLCRLKDPYLVAVNAAIFGNKDGNYPREGSEDYYKAAQQCSLFGVTFSDPDCTAVFCTNLEPKHITRTVESEMRGNDVSMERTQGDRNIKISASLQGNSRMSASTKCKISAPTEALSVTATKNVLTAPVFCNASTSLNQFQPALVGLNISQKSKVLPTPKFLPKGINFLTPQQIILQTAIQKNRQAANYPYTAPFQQTLSQPQPLLYTNPLLSSPYLNACFKETHINTSIIQQQQYNFFGAGTYEMLIYAQMLQQTQTIISKNRTASRMQDLARTSNPVPSLPNTQLQNPARSNTQNNTLPNFALRNPCAELFNGNKVEDIPSLQSPNTETNE